MRYLYFLAAFLLLMNANAYSQEVADNSVATYTYRADRPQLATSGEILPVKTFAIESGFRVNIIDQNNYAFHYNQTLVRIGMMKLMEMTVGLRVPGTLMAGKHEIGFASPKIGLKVLMKQKEDGSNMGLAFVGEAGINFGTENFKDTKVLPAFRIAMDIDLNEKTNMRINYGAEWRENRKVLDTEGNPAIDPFFIVALDINREFGDKIIGYLEVYANVKHDNFRSDYLLNGGLIYKLKSNVQLDVAAGAGLSPDSPRGVVQIGFSGVWPKKNL